jgi:hypothetical protein
MLLRDKKSETAHYHYTTTFALRVDFNHTVPLRVVSLSRHISLVLINRGGSNFED